MPAIAGVELLTYAAGTAEAGLAFFLSGKARRSRVVDLHADGWEVELRAGAVVAVARTVARLGQEALLNQAIDATHRALDLAALADGEALFTKSPATQHVIALANGEVTYLSPCEFPVDMSMEMTIRHADGTEERISEPPLPAWNPAFRFHRLSQSSRDLFDAYRNLFLGTEALFDQLFPKGRNEGERAWLLRSVREAGARIDLASIAPAGSADPASDIVALVYDVRLQLFHAKTNRALIPEETRAYLQVATAYPVLLSLWTNVVRVWLHLQRGGGVVTYVGFRFMVETAYATARYGLSGPIHASDSGDAADVSGNRRWSMAADTVHPFEVRPGEMGLSGAYEVTALPAPLVIEALAVLCEGEVMLTGTLPEALDLTGARRFLLTTVLRLKNSGSPKTEFS